jgi:hypothetical protein
MTKEDTSRSSHGLGGHWLRAASRGLPHTVPTARIARRTGVLSAATAAFRVRWEHRLDNFLGMLHLACALILLKHL